MTSSENQLRVEDTDCYKYAKDVIDGKIVTGKRVKQACKRFLSELKASKKKSYPWEFDVEKAYRPINFIEKFMRPTKGEYTQMKLLPWQHFIEGNIYGWIDKKTGLRRFREALILVGAGNGKSTLVTGNAAFGASKDNERGAEVYCLANSREQARIVFDECKTQIQASPILAKHFKVTRDGVYFLKTNSKILPLASDYKNLDGRNVHLAIFDEIQEYRDYKLINVIKAKTKKRRQPLIIYISTLGTVIDGPLMDYYILGGTILDATDAISKRAADRMFVFIAEIDEQDEPDNTDCWIKANPSLGALLREDDLIDEWDRCKAIPAERSNFINKQLNVFTLVDELSFLDPGTIQKNNQERSIESLEDYRCYGGFDLAETDDFTSACLEFDLGENKYFVLEHSWVPLPKVKENHEKLEWKYLVESGWLTVVNGDYVDYTLVLNWFLEKRDKYRIDTVGYDPAKAFMLVQELRKNGFVLNPVRQGEITLTAPLDHLKERFLDGNIIHNNNALFNWYLGNVKLTKRSVNATYMPTKQHRYRKIDGFAALLNAHTEYMNRNPIQIAPDQQLTTVIKL